MQHFRQPLLTYNEVHQHSHYVLAANRMNIKFLFTHNESHQQSIRINTPHIAVCNYLLCTDRSLLTSARPSQLRSSDEEMEWDEKEWASGMHGQFVSQGANESVWQYELRQRRHAKSWTKHLPTRGFIEKLNISMSIERYYLYACFHLLLKCTMNNQHMGICNTSNHRTIWCRFIIMPPTQIMRDAIASCTYSRF